MLASQTPVTGLFRGEVVRVDDPQKAGRLVLRVPQVLGDAHTDWAEPDSPPAVTPTVGSAVWVQFSGGDVGKPVYSAYSLQVDDLPQGPTADSTQPKPPSALAATTGYDLTADGTATAWLQLSWVAPTENTDSTPLTDFDHYEVAWGYDQNSFGPSGEVDDTVVRFGGLRPGVAVIGRVRSFDHSGNPSSWTQVSTLTASASDGPPQPSAPVAMGVLGGIRVSWDGLTTSGDRMPSTFSFAAVQRSTDMNFATFDTVAQFRGKDSFYDSGTGYLSAYYYRLVPFSKISIAGAASALSAPASAATAGSDDISADAIVANIINAGGITAEALAARSVTADKLASTLVIASTIKTADDGERVELSNDLLALYDEDGITARALFPTDSDQPVYINGEVSASALSVQDHFALGGTNNAATTGSVLSMQSQTTASNISPNVVQNWKTQATANGVSSGAGLEWDDTAQVFRSALWMANPSTFGANDLVVQTIARDGTVVASERLSGLRGGRVFGATRINGVTYVLYMGLLNGTQNSQSAGLFLASFGASAGLPAQIGTMTSTSWSPAIGNVGGRPAVATVSSAGAVQVTLYNTNLSTYGAISTPSSFNIKANLGGLYFGNADLGLSRLFIAGSGDYNVAYALTLSNAPNPTATTTRDPGHDFPLQTGYAHTGLAYDGTRFWSNPSNGKSLTSYSQSWWDASDATQSSVWWASFTWKQSVNGYETTQSRRTKFNALQRAFTSISVAAIPTTGQQPTDVPYTDPDSMRFYLGRGAADPGRTASWLQPGQPAVGGTAIFLDKPTFATTSTQPPSGSTFPKATPARVISGAIRNTGAPRVEINGDGLASFMGVNMGDQAMNEQAVLSIKYLAPNLSDYYERRSYLFAGADGQSGMADTMFQNGAEVSRIQQTPDGQFQYSSTITGNSRFSINTVTGPSHAPMRPKRYLGGAGGTTTGTDFVEVTGFSASFVAPSSGAVLVHLMMWLRTATAGIQAFGDFAIHDGSVSGTVVRAGVASTSAMLSNANTQWVKCGGTELVTGLTAGKTYYVMPGYSSNAAGTTITAGTPITAIIQPVM